jgi:hypothetical protein
MPEGVVMKRLASIACLASLVSLPAVSCELDGRASIGEGVHTLLCPAGEHTIRDVVRMTLLSGEPHPDLATIAMALNGIERGEQPDRQFARIEGIVSENQNFRTVLRAVLVEASFSARDIRTWCQAIGKQRTQFNEEELEAVARVEEVVQCELT